LPDKKVGVPPPARFDIPAGHRGEGAILTGVCIDFFGRSADSIYRQPSRRGRRSYGGVELFFSVGAPPPARFDIPAGHRGEGTAPTGVCIDFFGRSAAPGAIRFTGSHRGEGGAPTGVWIDFFGRSAAPGAIQYTGSHRGEGAAPTRVWIDFFR